MYNVYNACNSAIIINSLWKNNEYNSENNEYNSSFKRLKCSKVEKNVHEMRKNNLYNGK
jgi:hypothetical protein